MNRHADILKYGTVVRGQWLAYAVLALLVACRCLSANVALDMSEDRVFLSDGSILKCTLICRGKEAVIVLVGDEERTLSASSVLRIERGQPTGERKFFETGPRSGHEQIIGSAEENVPPPPPAKPVPAKPARPTKKHGRSEKGKEGVTPFGDRAKPKRKERQKELRPVNKPDNTAEEKTQPLPMGLDVAKIRKLINEVESDDLIKAIEDLRKRFGVDNNQ